MEYKVKYGDWVGKLISERFGPEGSESFRRAMNIFMQLNPDIEDINSIREGQKIRLPEPGIQHTPIYAEMFDLPQPEKEEEPEETPEIIEAVEDVKEPEPDTEIAEADEQERAETAERAISEQDGDEFNLPFPINLRGFAGKGVFVKAAHILNAQLLQQGQYFFPRSNQEDLRLTLSETPLMIFDSGIKLLFARQGRLSDADQRVIENHWPGTRFVFQEMNTPLPELLSTIINLIDSDGYDNRLTFIDNHVSLVLRGQFIYDPPGGRETVCLNVIEHPDMRVPSAICEYLEYHGVIVRDWVEGKNFSGWADEFYGEVDENVEFLEASIDSPAGLVGNLAGVLGYEYEQDVEFTFTYAGFQVNALINILTVGGQEEVLLDFGDLGGDAIEAIEKTGLRVIQIDRSADVRHILDALSPFIETELSMDPMFWTANRPRIFNPSLQIPGYLIEADRGEKEQQILLSSAAVPEKIADYLAETGVRFVRYAR